MDLRTRYTLNIINETFFRLLEEKPLDKITIAEICAISEINRSTFYRYYKDAYDVVDKKIQQVMLELREEIAKNPTEFEALFDRIFEILYQNKSFFLLLK